MNETEEDLHYFLESIKRDGEYDSSGSFSLDSQTSLEKLKKFRLGNPAELVLALVSCATYRGARHIQFEIGALNLRMAFDGKPFSHSDMDSIFSSYFSSDYSPGNRSRTEMAIALQTIQTLNPDFVVFESWNGPSGQVLQLYEGKVWLETLERKTRKETRQSFQYLCYEEPESFWKYCFPTLTRARRQEWDLLKQRCAFGPAQVWLNGRALEFRSREGKVYCFQGEGEKPYLPAVGPQTPGHPAPFWGTATLFSTAQEWLSLPSTIHWIVGGVSYPEISPVDFPERLELVVHAPELRKDLSNGNLIRDEAFANRREQLKQALRELIEKDDFWRHKPHFAHWLEPRPDSSNLKATGRRSWRNKVGTK